MAIYPFEEHELHLYVDGHLAEERRCVVEARLQDHPELTARVDDYRRQNELMRQLFEQTAEVPPTEAQERLLRKLDRRIGRSRFAACWRPGATAAAVLALAAGLGVGGAAVYDKYAIPAPEAVPSFAETAARVHSFYASAASEPTEFGADAAAKLGPMLDKRLGASLRLPDLSQKGFNLVAGRLLPSEDGTAAQLLYRDQAGRLVTVFLGPTDKTRLEPPHMSEPKDLSLYAWLDGRIGVAVVGHLSGDELRGIAEVAQRSLAPPGNSPRPEERPAVGPGTNGPGGASRT